MMNFGAIADLMEQAKNLTPTVEAFITSSNERLSKLENQLSRIESKLDAMLPETESEPAQLDDLQCQEQAKIELID